MRLRNVAVVVTAMTLAVGLAGPVSAANPHGNADNKGNKSDNRPGLLAKKQDALKQKAREMVFKGKATAKGKDQVVQGRQGPVRRARVRG